MKRRKLQEFVTLRQDTHLNLHSTVSQQLREELFYIKESPKLLRGSET